MRNERARAKSNLLAEQLSYHFRVTRDRVESEGKSQTQNCADEESAEDHFLLEIYLPRGANKEKDCGTDEHDAAEQMSPKWRKLDFITCLIESQFKMKFMKTFFSETYQIFPVSVCNLKMDLKHAPKDARGGRCPLCK